MNDIDNKLTDWCELPTQYGIFRMYDTGNDAIKLISVCDIRTFNQPILVRMHSSCVASEIFGALDCDCNDQLQETMKLMVAHGQGLIFHLHQEGRGHGLSNKIKACSIMQKQKITTAKSFDKMGLEQDIRNYDKVPELLKLIGITKIKLVTNNPRKSRALENHVTIIEQVTLNPVIRPENEAYLHSKNDQLGHCIPLAPLR